MFDNKFNSILIIFFLTLIYSCKQNLSKNDELSISNNLKPIHDNNNLEFNYYPTSTTNQIIKHEFYTLSYNEKYEQAEWVAYHLKSEMITRNHYKRPYFIEDPLVKTNSADWKNYKKSGYDKGHLCPAGDMKINQKAFNDTFFTSNISPQIHDFNDGVWNRLENKVRYWAQKYNGIYVITGAVLKNNLPTIGRENVAVPDSFYKVLLYNNNGNYKMISFLMPSQDSQKPLYEFVIETDKLEKLTGINFYPSLPDKIENVLEKSADYKSWSF